MERSAVSKATLGRLPIYLKYLKTLPGKGCVSATAIAKALHLGEVQVRKDLNSVSGSGKPKIGYVTEELTESIEKALGGDKMTYAVLVGAGRLGRALLNYDGFEEFGVCIIGAFDVNIENEDVSQVLPMLLFESYCKANKVHIGIITVSEENAQKVCDRMISSGIKAIWNFTPTILEVPENIIVKQENLALSLAHLSNQLVY